MVNRCSRKALGLHLLALLLFSSLSIFMTLPLAFHLRDSFPFAFCHYRLAQIPHIEMLAGQWFPFVFLFLWNFAERPTLHTAFGLGIFTSLQSLSSTYYALSLFLFGSPFFLAVLFAHRRPLTKRSLLLISVPVVIVTGSLLPFVSKYLAVGQEMGFSRTLRDVEYYAANFRMHISVPPYNLLLGKILAPPSTVPTVESILFPGLFASASALLAALFVEQGGLKPDLKNRCRQALRADLFKGLGAQRAWVKAALGLVIALAAYSFFLALSGGGILWPSSVLVPWLGPRLLLFISISCFATAILSVSAPRRAVFGWWQRKPLYVRAFALLGCAAIFFTFRLPYSALFLAFPPLRATRVPTRLTVITMLAVSVLSAVFLAALLRKFRSRTRAQLVSTLVLAFLLLEYSPRAFPVRRLSALTPGWASTKREMPPVYDFLRALPEPTPLLELPLYREDACLYYLTYHRNPLVTGYHASFEPTGWLSGLADFPSPESLEKLQDLPVELVVVHLWLYSPCEQDRFFRDLRATGEAVGFVGRYGGDLVYEVRKESAAPQQ